MKDKKCEFYHTSTCLVEDAIEINCTACHKKEWKAKLLIDLIFTGPKIIRNFGKAGTIINITIQNGLYGAEFQNKDGLNDFLPIDKKNFVFITELEKIAEFEKLKDNKLKFISKEQRT